MGWEGRFEKKPLVVLGAVLYLETASIQAFGDFTYEPNTDIHTPSCAIYFSYYIITQFTILQQLATKPNPQATDITF